MKISMRPFSHFGYLLALIPAIQAQVCTEEQVNAVAGQQNPVFCNTANPACTNCAIVADLNLVPGMAMPCADVEETLCPTIRCCEECWEETQLYNQCIVVDTSASATLIEPGCALDCTRFPIGATAAPAVDPTPSPMAIVDSSPTSASPTSAPVEGVTPDDTTPPPTPAPQFFANPFTPFPTSEDCNEEELDQKINECINRRNCNEFTCQRNFEGVVLDTSKIDDVCGFWGPLVCIVEACCPPCADEYKQIVSCGLEQSLLDCSEADLNCGPGDAGAFGDGASLPTFSAATLILLGLALVFHVN